MKILWAGGTSFLQPTVDSFELFGGHRNSRVRGNLDDVIKALRENPFPYDAVAIDARGGGHMRTSSQEFHLDDDQRWNLDRLLLQEFRKVHPTTPCLVLHMGQKDGIDEKEARAIESDKNTKVLDIFSGDAEDRVRRATAFLRDRVQQNKLPPGTGKVKS